MSGIEDKIRERAYKLWQQSDQRDGSEMDFWLQAEHEINKEKERPTEPPQNRLD